MNFSSKHFFSLFSRFSAHQRSALSSPTCEGSVIPLVKAPHLLRSASRLTSHYSVKGVKRVKGAFGEQELTPFTASDEGLVKAPHLLRSASRLTSQHTVKGVKRVKGAFGWQKLTPFTASDEGLVKGPHLARSASRLTPHYSVKGVKGVKGAFEHTKKYIFLPPSYTSYLNTAGSIFLWLFHSAAVSLSKLALSLRHKHRFGRKLALSLLRKHRFGRKLALSLLRKRRFGRKEVGYAASADALAA